MHTASGKAIIFSAPSGSGKTTLVKHLLDHNPDLAFSISVTTREKRPQEQDQRDYYFLTPPAFKAKIEEGAFAEWEEVYPDRFYGTLKSEIDRIWQQGKNVIFDVDVKGGLSLKRYFHDQALAVFVKVPSLVALENRLTARNTESPERIAERVRKAEYEMTFESKFDVTVVNDQLEQSLRQVQQLYDEFKKA